MGLEVARIVKTGSCFPQVKGLGNKPHLALLTAQSAALSATTTGPSSVSLVEMV